MSNVYAGYRGIAYVGAINKNVRFGDASISAKQTINAPDMIMGDWDHDAYVYGPIEVGGSIGGPATETFVGAAGSGGLWDWAVKRSRTCGTLTDSTVKLYYYCGGDDYNAREFTGMYANSVNFSCAAGDIANFSIDVMGSSAGDWSISNGTDSAFTDAEKLITWDKCSVNITQNGGEYVAPSYTLAFSNFDFNISNNLQVVYSLGQPNLFPFEIVPGLRTITGSLSIYNTPQFNGFDEWIDYQAENTSTIQFDIGGLIIDMRVRFHRVEPASSTGPITSTVGFTGVGHQSGSAWVG